jgi:N-acylneuraminate cytidylyltransferase
VINEKRVIGIIPARGGSKGVPRKNIRQLGGKPLIAWTIKAAQKSKYLDRLILSSDDKEIIEIALSFGCEAPFVRPAELAEDCTPGIAPVLHALETVQESYDYMVMLQPTSPFRTAADIDSALEKCVTKRSPSCVTVNKVDKSPHWMYLLDENDQMLPLLKQEMLYSRRQDLPPVYALNGAVYIAAVEWLIQNQTFVSKETVAHIMPEGRSVDIDSELDFEMCEYLLSKGKF